MSKRIRTATIEICYADDGQRDAPALVFSNSLGANLSMWQAQADFFSPDYRVIRYDQRGHGGSAVPPGPYTFELLCRDVVALLDALNVERAHFVGLSMGGMTALGMALDHADRLRSITACNCVASFGPDGATAWGGRIAAVSGNGLASILDMTLQRWFTQAAIDARPDDMRAVREMISETPLDGYIGCCEALQTLDYDSRLDAIATPTLFVAGSHDVGTPASEMQKMHQRVKNSSYVELDAAHVSNMERPTEFNAALARFLQSV